jgi:hypothetical protein
MSRISVIWTLVMSDFNDSFMPLRYTLSPSRLVASLARFRLFETSAGL